MLDLTVPIPFFRLADKAFFSKSLEVSSWERHASHTAKHGTSIYDVVEYLSHARKTSFSFSFHFHGSGHFTSQS